MASNDQGARTVRASAMISETRLYDVPAGVPEADIPGWVRAHAGDYVKLTAEGQEVQEISVYDDEDGWRVLYDGDGWQDEGGEGE